MRRTRGASAPTSTTPREEATETEEGVSFAERDANVTRVRRRRFLTFRVGGAARTPDSTRASAPGDDAESAVGDDEDGEDDEDASDAPPKS